MHIYDNSNYKKLFSISNDQLVTLENLVNSETIESWNARTYRQDRNNVQKDTKAIIFKDIKIKKIQIQKTEACERYSLVDEIIAQTAKVLNIKKYVVTHSLLANLPAGKKIEKHTDSKGIFQFTHRIHVPIITDPKCEFIVENEKIPMLKGDVIEINNLKYHQVTNRSNIDRVHLLFDFKEDLS